MHQSGSHWLKHLLASAIAKEYGHPQPKFNTANDLIGGPKDNVLLDKGPRLAHNHSIPNPLLYSKVIRNLSRLPKYVVLIRNIDAILVSKYMKWNKHYDCPFSEYIRDTDNRNFTNEVWWCIRFLNGWGHIQKKFPEETFIIRYEDLCKDNFSVLKKINEFLALKLSDESIKYGINESSKEKMMKKIDPDNPEGEGAVSQHNMKPEGLFTHGDKKYLSDQCSQLLKYSFGYNHVN